MLQALLALALVVAFLPMFAKKIEERNIGRENAAIASQMSRAAFAARAFVSDKMDDFPDGVEMFEENDFSRELEPYGLSLGFVPRVGSGGAISLVISKSKDDFFAALVASGARLSDARRMEILARIGFWGIVMDENGTLRGATGGWFADALPNNLFLDPNDIMVRIPEDEEFSELVRRRAKAPEKNIFHTDLDMGGNDVGAVRTLEAETGKFKSVRTIGFSLSGTEPDRKNKNEIGLVRADKVRFSASIGNPLTIVRSDLKTGTFSAAEIANFGEAPALTAKEARGKSFAMTAGRAGFYGPARWEIKGTANFTNVTLNIDKLGLSSFLDTSRGQNAYVDQNSPSELEYSSLSGVRANIIKTDNIVMRDQISAELNVGGRGRAMIEIRPGGASSLPDVLLVGIDNDLLSIPLSAAGNDGRLESCRSVISGADGRYNAASLADAIACRFVMYNRIEQRIDIKKCLMDGGEKCG